MTDLEPGAESDRTPDDAPDSNTGKKPKHPTQCSGSPSVNGCRRKYKDHSPREDWCVWCGGPPEHHRPGQAEAELIGAARMAAARSAAGVAMTDRDHRALREVEALPGVVRISWVPEGWEDVPAGPVAHVDDPRAVPPPVARPAGPPPARRRTPPPAKGRT